MNDYKYKETAEELGRIFRGLGHYSIDIKELSTEDLHWLSELSNFGGILKSQHGQAILEEVIDRRRKIVDASQATKGEP